MNPFFRSDRARGPDEPKSRVAVLARGPLPMVEVEGPRHVVFSVNAAFCGLLRKRRDELVGRPFGELVNNGERCVALLDRIYATGEFEVRVEPDDSGPEPAHWLFAMWPALGKDRKPERVVIQLTRSSRFHQTIREMNEALMLAALQQHAQLDVAEKANARLKEEVEERDCARSAMREAIDQLIAAQAEARRESRAKDHFLATLSHELRTPLTPVLLTAASLREDTRLPEEVRLQLGTIERNVELEARLIDDLLDLTKISHGKLEFRPEPCDAHRLIRFALEMVRSDAAAKGISVTCELEAKYSGLTADPARFQQVIWNLLRNAVKFTPNGGKVGVRTVNQIDAKEDCRLRIEVVDTGIGIEAERLEEIFLPFEQGGLAGDHRFGGVGLGLAIARSVVHLHHGEISAQSRGRNLGATLIVELPGATLARPQLADGIRTASTSLPRDSRSRDDTTGAALRILVVDDHASTLEALRRVLQRDGHEVSTAATADAALAVAATTNFDLVISDLGLPDGSGLDLMRKLRERHSLQGVALSGYAMDEDLQHSRDAGFSAHLAKPVAVAELRRVITSVSEQAT